MPLGVGNNPTNHDKTWSVYNENLPDYLIGTTATSFVNNGGGVQIELTEDTKVYLMQITPSWRVDLTGYTQVASGSTKYIEAYESMSSHTMEIYEKDFTAGTYNFDTDSAWYFFKKINNQSSSQPQELEIEIVNTPTCTENFAISSSGLALRNCYTNTSVSWTSYKNIPEFLTGLKITTHINNGEIEMTFNKDTTVYLLHSSNWTLHLPSEKGFTNVIHTQNYMFETTNGSLIVSVYEKQFPKGTHTINTLQAMYMFE